MKAYGASICIDCRNFKAICKNRGIEIDYMDICESTANLRTYLEIRDNLPAFAEIRERGGLGIPFFIDGDRFTIDIDEALSWIGQPPVKEEEIVEHRGFVCDTCQ